MTYTRLTGALSALTLAIVLAACSTPDDLAAPILEPQFGTADNDYGVDVATVSTGRIYSISMQSGDTYKNDYDGTSYVNGFYTKVLLTRRDSSGNTVWTKEATSTLCDYDDYSNVDYDNGCGTLRGKSVHTDAQGYIYVFSTYNYHESYNSVDFTNYMVQKLNASGAYVDSFSLGNGENYDTAEISLDSSGNMYFAGRECDHVYDDNYLIDKTTCLNKIIKYSTSGALQWQRTSTVGVPTDITVSSSGSVYVAGSTGYARYSSTGGLTWTKTGASDEIIVSGSNIYTRYRSTIRRHDSTGKTLWSKTQSGLSSAVFADMTGDGSGNVYLAGKYSVTSTNRDAFARKLNSSGSVLWTKTYGTPAYDDARGIATITGSEIYTTGETQGSLVHTNIGGRDGYLRKFSSSGGTIWTK